MQPAKLDDLIGKVMKSVTISSDRELMVFTTVDGEVFHMLHFQDCCERVSIEDVVGDLSDLVGNPILVAESSSNCDEPSYDAESWTWTFYKFATIKGYVDIRWFGSSNGYYSESVEFVQVK